jgi:hypothetical protein
MAVNEKVWEVRYEIWSCIDHTRVGDGVTRVTAPARLDVAPIANAWIDRNDLRYDLRIDPMIRLTSIARVDEEDELLEDGRTEAEA